ncbi:MAG TPA: DHHA1 domain-containing protein, partial [Roseiflexaceae bacterium]|nr:DHHA1 domain-containing protein [Roseiflexaceae bacterium]
YQHDSPIPDVDLAILADTASLARAGRVYEEHAATIGELPIVVIDHHVTNDGGGQVNLIRPASASACELLYSLFKEMNVAITPDLATCLLLGLTTDTQSFQTSATKAESLHIAADLIDLGADHARIVHEVYYALPSSSAVLIGKAMAEMRRDGPIVWTVISQAMSRATGAEDEAADEVVRMMQRIEGVRALVMFKERMDGTTKISLRSKPPINVAKLAQVWGGGGHAQAAGATLLMSPAEAEREVLPRLHELLEKV